MRVVALVEDEEYEDEIVGEVKVSHEEENEEAVLYADQGLSIVVQRNLRLASEEINEDSLRTNVFHTRCTVKGRVCLTIIDSVSFENVASSEMVQKLDLKVVPIQILTNYAGFKKGMKLR